MKATGITKQILIPTGACHAIPYFPNARPESVDAAGFDAPEGIGVRAEKPDGWAFAVTQGVHKHHIRKNGSPPLSVRKGKDFRFVLTSGHLHGQHVVAVKAKRIHA